VVRFYRVTLIAVLVLAMLLGLSATGFAYGEPASNSSLNFSDLDQASWAKKSIIRLKTRGITAGYTDGTYRPNFGVKQVEALIMAVRELGLTQEAADLAASSNLSLPEAFGRDIPDWAKGFVYVGWQRGLIKTQDNNFDWSAPASRAWVAQLAVRMLGMQNQVVGESSLYTLFIDDASFPEGSRGYIYAAVERGIFVGYQDGSFQPDRVVTRAEIATIFAKCEKLMKLDGLLQGTVEDTNEDNFIIYDAQGTLYRIFVANGAWIFRGNETVVYDTIEEGDGVSLVLTGNNIAGFIDVESTATDNGDTDYVEGEVIRVDSSGWEIRIEDEDGDRSTYAVDRDADIIIDRYRNPSLSDINEGDEVRLQVEDDEVVRIEVIEGGGVEFIVGLISRVDSSEWTIRIEDWEGDRTTYDVDSAADIEVDGDTSADLDDLVTDKPVKLVLDGDEVTEIIQGRIRSGTVSSVDESDYEILIERSTGIVTNYEVNDDVIVEFDSEDIDLDDLVKGDEVDLYEFDDEIYLIVVTDRD